MWSDPKAVFGALLMRDYSAGRARTPKQVIGSLLIPFLTIALLMAAVGAVSFFLPVSDTFRDAVYTSGRIMLIGCVFFYPVYHGLAFRIRIKRDFRNALASVALYFPILAFASIAYMHLILVLSDGDKPILTFSWFEIFLAAYFCTAICIFTLLTYRIRSAWAPAPAMTAHPYYQRTENAVSLGSLFGVVTVILLAS